MVFEKELTAIQTIVDRKLSEGKTADPNRRIKVNNIVSVTTEKVILTGDRELDLSGLNLNELYDIEYWITQQQMKPTSELAEAAIKVRESIGDEVDARKFYGDLIKLLEDEGKFAEARTIRDIMEQEGSHAVKLKKMLPSLIAMRQSTYGKWIPSITRPKRRIEHPQWIRQVAVCTMDPHKVFMLAKDGFVYSVHGSEISNFGLLDEFIAKAKAGRLKVKLTEGMSQKLNHFGLTTVEKTV